MKKIVFMIITLIILTISLNAGSPKKIRYDIEEFQNQEKTNYNFNKFYPVYYFYTNIFFSLNLNDNLTFNEKSSIIKKLTEIISKNNIARITFKKYSQNKDLIITLKPDHPPKFPNETILWLISNYDKNKNKLVYDDDMKNAFATFYNIKGSKLIKYQKMYSKEEEEKLKKEKNMNNLADLYIFDEQENNDDEAEKILLNELDTSEDINHKVVCLFTLTEYYLSKMQFDKAESNLKEIDLLLKDKNIKHYDNYFMYFNALKDMKQIIRSFY